MRDRFITQVSNEGVYSKKIDNSEPELLYNGTNPGGMIYGRVLTPFFNDQCLLALKIDSVAVLFINDEFKVQDEKEIQLAEDQDYCDSAVIGQDKILILYGKYLSFYEIGLDNNQLEIKKLSEVEIKGIEGKEDVPMSFSVSENGKNLMIFQSTGWSASGLVVYQIGENYQFIRKCDFDLGKAKIEDNFSSLIFVKECGILSYFCAVPDVEDEKSIFTFAFDCEKNEIIEIEELRRKAEFGKVLRFCCVEKGCFIGLSNDDLLVKIEYL